MEIAVKRAGAIVAVALIVTIVTQIIYMVTLGGPQPSDPAAGVTHADVVAYMTDRWSDIATVWLIELAAFAAIAVGSLVLMARSGFHPAAWATLALSGLFNMIQIGFGLSMFRPISIADEAFEPVALTIVAGAFFFYFLAKILIGLAGIGLGFGLFRGGTISAKAVGSLAIVAGFAAAIVNAAALPQGMAMVFPAGATGTVAALFTGLAALLVTRYERRID